MDTNQLSRRSLFAAPAIISAAQSSRVLRVAFVGVGNRGSYLLSNMLKVAGTKVSASATWSRNVPRAGAAAVEGKGGGAGLHRLPQDARRAQGHRCRGGGHARLHPSRRRHRRARNGQAPLRRKAPGPQHRRLQDDPQHGQAGQGHHAGGLPVAPRRRITRRRETHPVRRYRKGPHVPRHPSWRRPAARHPVVLRQNKCGDIVVDQGIHILDLFRWAIGSNPPVARYGFGGTNLFVNVPPGRTVMDTTA